MKLISWWLDVGAVIYLRTSARGLAAEIVFTSIHGSYGITLKTFFLFIKYLETFLLSNVLQCSCSAAGLAFPGLKELGALHRIPCVCGC